MLSKRVQSRAELPDEPPRARARPPHPAQFDGKPFNKGSMAASVIATVAGGAGGHAPPDAKPGG